MRVWKRGEKKKGREKDMVRRRGKRTMGTRGRGVDNTRKEAQSPEY